MPRAPFFALALALACVAVATGGDVALLWSEATTGTGSWSARRGHAAAIFADGTVLSLGGRGGGDTFKNDVFRLTPGSTTLEKVSNAAWYWRWGLCAVVLRGTDEIVIMGGRKGAISYFGFGGLNDAWRSSDKGVTFVKISGKVWNGNRFGAGCVSINATKLFAFGGQSSENVNDGGGKFVVHNGVRVSTDAGASWSNVNHTSCGASAPMWSVRHAFGYTYMPLLGRIVIAGGRESPTVYHNDIWFSQSDAKCWTLAKADVNSAVDGYSGATLVTAPFGGVEALLLLGGNTWHSMNTAGTSLNTIQLSLDGGFSWSVVASAAAAGGGPGIWSGRNLFTAIVDTVSSRLLVWGGKGYGGVLKGDLWSTSLDPLFATMLPPFAVFIARCEAEGTCRVTGNQLLTVRGTNFTDAKDLAVSIGSSGACTNIQVINPNKATCTTPCLTTWSSALSIIVTSSSAPGGTFNTTAVSVATGPSMYPGIAANKDYVCAFAPIITSIACNIPAACSATTSLGVTTHVKMAANTLVTIKGMNFGAIKPKLNIDLTIAAIDFGTTQCFQTVTSWSATSITLRVCAASGTNLPIHITLGNKTSPPFATLITVSSTAVCLPGEYSDANNKCALCPSGRHGKTVPAMLMQCYPCGLGAFSGTPGATACKPCGLNSISGVVDNATRCGACDEGSIRDPNRVFCTKCNAGKSKVLSTDMTTHTCDDCPSAKYAAAGSASCSTCEGGGFPDKARGSCLQCSSGAYRAYDDDCSTCPTVGVDCEGSALQIKADFWLPPLALNITKFKFTSTTKLYPCANAEACLTPLKSALTVTCSAGYMGPLCGACDLIHQNYIRNGDLCVECAHPAVNILLTLCLGLGLIGLMGYYVVLKRLDASSRDDQTGVTLKLLMGYSQMLSVLGVFKAKGTAMFRKIAQWPATIGGGGVTSALFVKCALRVSLYGPFWMNMLAPIVAALLALAFIIPKWRYERRSEAKRRQDDAWGTHAPNEHAWIGDVVDAADCKDRVLLRIGCPSRELSAEDKLEWRLAKLVEKEAVFNPWLRLAAVLIFVLFSLYPTLIASAIGVMRCSDSIDEKRYLVEDYAKECFTEEHNWYVGFGVVFTAIYALGIPLGAFILIWRFRKPIADGNATAHSSLGFLFAGYSTTRGGFIIAWESMIMLRKLVVTLLSIIDFSPAVQLMLALLLLVISLLLTVNIRPYETRALNYLEECSLLVLMLTQAVSLIYLDADAKALATGSRDETNEAWATFVLLVLNVFAFIALGGAFAIAVVRYYGPKVQVCLPGDCCASAAARVLDETWEEIGIVAPNIELVWVDAADGVTIVDAPDGVIVMWQDSKSGAIVAPFCGGLALPPPMGYDLVVCDATTGDLAAVGADRAPAWRNTVTGALVMLDDVRSCTMWLNHRTGALSRVNPHVEVVETPLRIADAGAAGAAGAAVAADVPPPPLDVNADGLIDAFASPPPFDVNADGLIDAFAPPPPFDVNADDLIDAFAPPPPPPGGGGRPPSPTPAPVPFVIDMAAMRQDVLNPAGAALRTREGEREFEMTSFEI